MKSFGRVCSGIAVIMLGVGILLTAIGAGRMKNNWSVPGDGQTGQDMPERAFDGNIASIELRVPYGAVRIESSGDEQIYFSAERITADSFEIKEDDGTLSFMVNTPEEKKLHFLGISFPAEEISRCIEGVSDYPVYVLRIPKNYRGKISVELQMGVFEASCIAAESLDVNVKTGELTIYNSELGSVNARCNAGSVTISGKCRELVSHLDVGSQEITILGSEDDYSGELSCSVGTVEREFRTTPYHELSEELMIKDARLVDLECYDGFKNRCAWQNTGAEGMLKVTGNMGEVRVRFLTPED